MVNWQSYIVADTQVLLGKPTVRGTRLSVSFILQLLANGWTEEQILQNYPRLTKEGLQAVFAYAHDCLKDDLLFSQPVATSP